jgi:four helix bundle protein
MKNRTKQFALVVIRLCRTLQNAEARIISRQLPRSATSVAANYRAVCRARSTADFTSKLGLVLEEADETLFWLELLIDAGISRREQIHAPLNEANQLVSIFVASLRTAKGLKSEI